MKVTAIDVPLDHPDVVRLGFRDAADLSSSDVTIWNPRGLAATYQDMLERPGVLSVAGSERLLADARRWRGAFRDLLEAGGFLVVLAAPEEEIGVHTLQEIVPFRSYEPLPAPAFRAVARPPAGVRCGAGEPFRSFFETVGPMLVADCTLDGEGQVIATADGAAAAIYAYRAPGHLLLLPGLRMEATGTGEAKTGEAGTGEIGMDEKGRAGALLSALRTLTRRLRHPTLALGRVASWVEAHVLPGEADTLARLRALRQEHARRARELASLEREAARFAFLKQLVGGRDAAIVAAAAAAFQAAGGTVQANVVGEDTLVVESAAGFAVVLVWHPAAEGDPLARLADAVAAFTHDFGAAAKGILLDCRDNDMPPAARPAERVRRLATDAAARGFELLTGETLLRRCLATAAKD